MYVVISMQLVAMVVVAVVVFILSSKASAPEETRGVLDGRLGWHWQVRLDHEGEGRGFLKPWA